MMRASGILLPISSIPSNYGIGCFSKEAYAFVDQLAEAGQKYWQILPLGPTGYGDSPYQSFSTFAGNPYFIDLEELIQRDLLTAAECAECDWGGSKSYVDYEKVYLSRFSLLRKAYRRFYQMDGKEKELQLIREEMEAFEKEQGFWLADYCLYMAVKDSLEGISWNQWPEDLKTRKPEALAKAREELKEDISFYAFQQFWFYRQWSRLKKYANEVLRSSVIFLSMWLLTAQMHGRTRICSSLMRRLHRQQWQDVLQTLFPQLVSCGEIHFIIGNIIRKQVITGGSFVWLTV